MKVLLTGAHFTPAVAVAEELKKIKNVSVVYVGRKTTLEGDNTLSRESQVFPKLGIKFIPIITGRLQRKFTIYTIPSLLKIPIGIIQSIYILFKEKPDVILSFGGYVAVPIVIIGWFFSIPIIIHEQTLVSGLANRLSALFADKICLSFDSPKKNGRTIITGNPLRKEIINPIKNIPSEFNQIFECAKKKNLPTVLVLGGNQGSHSINVVIEQCLNKLSKLACVIHQTGDSAFGDFERLKLLENENYLVKKWIGDEIGGILSKVDFVISRAGANTLNELAFFGKPALIIPFEPLYQDEQVKNAKYFEKLGSVKILPQSKLSAQTLVENIRSSVKNLGSLTSQAENAKKIVISDATKRLALEVVLLGR